jgi:hypothetical protein
LARYAFFTEEIARPQNCDYRLLPGGRIYGNLDRASLQVGDRPARLPLRKNGLTFLVLQNLSFDTGGFKYLPTSKGDLSLGFLTTRVS